MLDALGRDVDDPVRQLKGHRVAHLEGGGIVQFRRLLLDRFDDFRTAVTGVAAPQACGAVQHLPPVAGGVMHVLGRDEHPRVLLELAVRGKGHPERVEVIRGVAVKGHGCLLIAPWGYGAVNDLT